VYTLELGKMIVSTLQRLGVRIITLDSMVYNVPYRCYVGVTPLLWLRTVTIADKDRVEI
jgi:hypothetical protein